MSSECNDCEPSEGDRRRCEFIAVRDLQKEWRSDDDHTRGRGRKAKKGRADECELAETGLVRVIASSPFVRESPSANSPLASRSNSSPLGSKLILRVPRRLRGSDDTKIESEEGRKGGGNESGCTFARLPNPISADDTLRREQTSTLTEKQQEQTRSGPPVTEYAQRQPWAGERERAGWRLTIRPEGRVRSDR